MAFLYFGGNITMGEGNRIKECVPELIQIFIQSSSSQSSIYVIWKYFVYVLLLQGVQYGNGGFWCQAIFAQAKFARPSLPGPSLPSQVCPKSKFAQSQICPNPNLPGPIFAPAKFAQTHFCPEMNLATFHSKTAKFQVKFKKKRKMLLPTKFYSIKCLFATLVIYLKHSSNTFARHFIS